MYVCMYVCMHVCMQLDICVLTFMIVEDLLYINIVIPICLFFNAHVYCYVYVNLCIFDLIDEAWGVGSSGGGSGDSPTYLPTCKLTYYTCLCTYLLTYLYIHNPRT